MTIPWFSPIKLPFMYKLESGNSLITILSMPIKPCVSGIFPTTFENEPTPADLKESEKFGTSKLAPIARRLYLSQFN